MSWSLFSLPISERLSPYRQITDGFRKSYALLWQSLIFGDAEGIKQHSQAMNAGDMYPLFAGMLTNRPWDEVLDVARCVARVNKPAF